MGHHCEIFSDISELISVAPRNGIVLARDDKDSGSVADVLQQLAEQGIWLPVVATSTDPRPGQVVEAIKDGALDYLRLPLREERLVETVSRVQSEAQSYVHARRKMIEARNRIGNLSPREREVLDRLTEGCSNKLIARELRISPRTVEIHRSNMMTKLGAHHAAEAVRLHIEAHLDGRRQAGIAR